MITRKIAVLLLSTAAGAVIGGATLWRNDDGGRARWTLATLPQVEVFEDEPMIAIARELPTFGGFWFSNDDAIVVGLTKVGDLERAIELIKPWLGAHKPTRGYVALQVEYPFIQLAHTEQFSVIMLRR